MRIGLVGTGPWARETHIPAMTAHPGVDLTGVWSRDPASAAGIDVPRVADFDELLAGNDAIAFAVPPSVQARLAGRAAAAGKHLILDKPIADSLTAATALVDAIEAAGVTSIVCFTRRFAPETRAFVAAADVADVRSGSGTWLSGSLLGGRYAASAWRAETGALFDVGPHVIDLLDRVLGPITGIVGARHDAESDLWTVMVDHAAGPGTARTSTMSLSLRVPVIPTVTRFEVAGPGGLVSLSERRTTSPECFSVLLDEFLAAVATGRPHELDVRRGLAVQRVIDAITRAVSHQDRSSIASCKSR